MCVINIHDRKSKETPWVSLFIEKNTALYYDPVGIEYIPQEVLNKTRNESITHNILRILDDDTFMWGFYCITLVEYMVAGETFLDHTNLFSPKNYEKMIR